MTNNSHATVEFVRQLVSAFDDFRDAYLEHLQANDEILPYVLMDELSRIVVDQFRDKAPESKELFDRFSSYLENALVNSNNEISTMIKTTFCETVDSIWQETELHRRIMDRLGPNLTKCLLVR